jgi:short subunit dehydrogenase-like uncharacterized protein
LAAAPVHNVLKSLAAMANGPSDDQLSRQSTYVWGEVTNDRGEKKTARIRTANGYAVTITGSLAVVDYLLREHPVGGSYTPAKLMGADLVTKLPGSSELSIS